jgi:hypothetical protein
VVCSRGGLTDENAESADERLGCDRHDGMCSVYRYQEAGIRAWRAVCWRQGVICKRTSLDLVGCWSRVWQYTGSGVELLVCNVLNTKQPSHTIYLSDNDLSQSPITEASDTDCTRAAHHVRRGPESHWTRLHGVSTRFCRRTIGSRIGWKQEQPIEFALASGDVTVARAPAWPTRGLVGRPREDCHPIDSFAWLSAWQVVRQYPDRVHGRATLF